MEALRIGLAATALLITSVALAQAQAPATAGTPADASATAEATDAAPAGKLRYTDDYRISVDEDAESDGEIVFGLTPEGGTTQEVKVAITKGTSENNVAGEIKKAFKAQIGTKDYNIEMEDGENVIIERSMGAKDYSLVLASSTVKGVTVKVHRD
jgi:hypothetical protein